MDEFKTGNEETNVSDQEIVIFKMSDLLICMKATEKKMSYLCKKIRKLKKNKRKSTREIKEIVKYIDHFYVLFSRILHYYSELYMTYAKFHQMKSCPIPMKDADHFLVMLGDAENMIKNAKDCYGEVTIIMANHIIKSEFPSMKRRTIKESKESYAKKVSATYNGVSALAILGMARGIIENYENWSIQTVCREDGSPIDGNTTNVMHWTAKRWSPAGAILRAAHTLFNSNPRDSYKSYEIVMTAFKALADQADASPRSSILLTDMEKAINDWNFRQWKNNEKGLGGHRHVLIVMDEAVKSLQKKTRSAAPESE